MSSNKGNGPVYGVELIDTLPLGKGGFFQEMPSEADLRDVMKRSRCGERVAAGYEVLLNHYRTTKDLLGRIADQPEAPADVSGDGVTTTTTTEKP